MKTVKHRHLALGQIRAQLIEVGTAYNSRFAWFI